MSITRERYRNEIKPFVDIVYRKAKNLPVSEEVLFGSLLRRITEHEFEFDKLKEDLSNLTELQLEFFKKVGAEKELERARKVLEEEED